MKNVTILSYIIVLIILFSPLSSAESLEVANITLYVVGQCYNAIKPPQMQYDELELSKPPCSLYDFKNDTLAYLNNNLTKWENIIPNSSEERSQGITPCRRIDFRFKTKEPPLEIAYDGVWVGAIYRVNTEWLSVEYASNLILEKALPTTINFLDTTLDEKLGCNFGDTLVIIQIINFRPENLSNETGFIDTKFNENLSYLLGKSRKVERLRVHRSRWNDYYISEINDEERTSFRNKIPRNILILGTRAIYDGGGGWQPALYSITYKDWIRTSKQLSRGEIERGESENESERIVWGINKKIREEREDLDKKFDNITSILKSSNDTLSLDVLDNLTSYLLDVYSELREADKEINSKEEFIRALDYVLTEEHDLPSYDAFRITLMGYYNELKNSGETARRDYNNLHDLYIELRDFTFFQRDQLRTKIQNEKINENLNLTREGLGESQIQFVTVFLLTIISILITLSDRLFKGNVKKVVFGFLCIAILSLFWYIKFRIQEVSLAVAFIIVLGVMEIIALSYVIGAKSIHYVSVFIKTLPTRAKIVILCLFDETKVWIIGKISHTKEGILRTKNYLEKRIRR